MKQHTFFITIITILGIIGEVLSPQVPFNKEGAIVQPISDSETLSSVSHDDDYHRRRRKRCKRYVQNYYGGYVPARPYYEYGYRPQMPVYVPPRCYTPFCYSCPTSSCRRRCPKPTPPATIIVRPPSLPKACNCDPKGSKYQPCDPNTGNCMCKPNYVGRSCNFCKDGYWKNASGECVKCQCNEFGSKDSNCNKTNGQCSCSRGVQGIACDRCLPNYYGTVDTGCIECEPCTKKGHICGKGGKCVCPPLTAGHQCERCIANAWGHQGIQGCKLCNCSSTGSAKLQCDKNSGTCICKPGFEREKCDRCSFGYYGYPNCQKCSCSPSGTEESECTGDVCKCSEEGLCKCKKYVHGNKCDNCREGTFGVDRENPFGCTKCFCFERSTKCMDSKYNWDKIHFQKQIESNEPVSNSDILSLPRQFLGDRTTSYGGYLTVNEKSLKDGQFSVILHGNGIKLHSTTTINSSELKLNEKYWRIVSSTNGHCRGELSRDCFMLALQNITAIIVEGRNMEITEILLDVAKPDLLYNRPSHSIEKCQCPPQYTGLSCQYPSEGYYKHFPKSNHWIDDIIGIAKPCECNGHSKQCNSNTGYCKNCSDFRDGRHCELCAAGYYMDYKKDCLPCLCPSLIENNAKSCVATKYDFVCKCKEGYTGAKCEHCSPGYFKDIKAKKCSPCSCNTYGSYSQTCDKFGTCSCKPGFEGQKCNQCHNKREYIKDGLCVPCDECTQLLFNDIDKLTKALNETFGLFDDGIAPPWKKLTELMEKNKMLSKKFQEKNRQYDKIMKEHNITEYENKINKLRSKAELQNKIAIDLEGKSNNLKNSSTNLEEDLEKLKTKLRETIKTLENFGTQHISVKDAIKKANKILRAMEEISIAFERLEDDKLFKYCSDINKIIEDTYKNSTVMPKHLIQELLDKLDDIDKIAADVAQRNAIADDLNKENSERLERLKLRIKDVNKENDRAQNNINDIINKLGAINDTFHKLEKVYDDMRKFKFDDTEKLEVRLKRDMESMDDVDDLFTRATQHAEELEKTVEDYKNIFNFTKDEWKTIKASGTYDEIIRGIKLAGDQANEAARILKNATSIINPSDTDGLVDKTNLAHAYSDRLKKRIVNLKNMSSNFNAIKNKLEEFKYKLLESGKANNDLTQILHGMEVRITSQNDLVDRLYDAIDNSTDISEKMRQIEKDLYNLNLASRYDLFKKYKTYLAMISEKEMDILKKNLTYARDELNRIDFNSPIIDDTKNWTETGGQSKLDSIRDKIKELQNKVKYAKQAADSINVAMGLTNNCTMTYHIPQTEIFRSLSITYNCYTCNLFKWSNYRGDYLNLVVVNEEVLLELSVNGKKLKLKQRSVNEGEKIIFLEKVGSNVDLRFSTGERMTGSLGNELLTIYDIDDISVGSENAEPNGENNSYIYKITLNSYNIGLWKFVNTKGKCVGKARVNAKIEDEGRPFYIGNGYRTYNLHSNQRPSGFSLQFKIATFDDNSLIYLAQEKETPCAFIALYLEKGQVVLKVRHNNNQEKILKGTKKVNDGKTNLVELTMTYSSGKQHYKLNNVSESEILDRTHVFRIKKANQYVGGVPPTYDDSCVGAKVNITSFLGFLSSSQLINYDDSYGVIWQIGELNLNKAWFIGNGHLKVSKEIQPKGSSKLSFSFVFRPVVTDGVIMNVTKLGVISLANKRLKIEFSKPGQQEIFVSSAPVVVDDYNMVIMDIKKENVTISLNGETEPYYTRGRIKLDEIEIKMGKSDKGDSYYRGGIADIIINNITLYFNNTTVKDFANVEIGREPPIKRSPMPQVKGLILPGSVSNSMQNTEGCAITGNYVLDSNAVKFGDKPNSFIKIKTPFWKKNYTIGLEFRTFHSSGVLFLTTGGNQHQHYNFLELKDGRLNLYIKGKRRRKDAMPISMHRKVNDGKWHKLHIIKKARHLSMSLDNEKSKPIRVPKNRVKNEIWLGGVHDYTDYRELKDKLHPFRGCMKSFVINSQPANLMKNNKDVFIQNVTQCFPHVEEGAYFGGDAYAVYGQNILIERSLELSFEFRTTEQNGVLLSASSPSLSVELQDGAVVMTVDIGNGLVSKQSNNLGSEFALCNNRWHNVTAKYSTSELTVIVDGIRRIWVLDLNSLMEEISAPVYIGGIPDNVPHGMLKIRENFKGCIKNLVIDNKFLDWSDMEELNRVLLNSCPIVPGEE